MCGGDGLCSCAGLWQHVWWGYGLVLLWCAMRLRPRQTQIFTGDSANVSLIQAVASPGHPFLPRSLTHPSPFPEVKWVDSKK